MGKSVLHVCPFKKSDSGVNHTTEYRGCIYKVVWGWSFSGNSAASRGRSMPGSILKTSHELQELESEQDAVFYNTVYSNDGYKTTLIAFDRGWCYIYWT